MFCSRFRSLGLWLTHALVRSAKCSFGEIHFCVSSAIFSYGEICVGKRQLIHQLKRPFSPRRFRPSRFWFTTFWSQHIWPSRIGHDVLDENHAHDGIFCLFFNFLYYRYLYFINAPIQLNECALCCRCIFSSYWAVFHEIQSIPGLTQILFSVSILPHSTNTVCCCKTKMVSSTLIN